jgi:hypothetical protein
MLTRRNRIKRKHLRNEKHSLKQQRTWNNTAMVIFNKDEKMAESVTQNEQKTDGSWAAYEIGRIKEEEETAAPYDS